MVPMVIVESWSAGGCGFSVAIPSITLNWPYGLTVTLSILGRKYDTSYPNLFTGDTQVAPVGTTLIPLGFILLFALAEATLELLEMVLLTYTLKSTTSLRLTDTPDSVLYQGRFTVWMAVVLAVFASSLG